MQTWILSSIPLGTQLHQISRTIKNNPKNLPNHQKIPLAILVATHQFPSHIFAFPQPSEPVFAARFGFPLLLRLHRGRDLAVRAAALREHQPHRAAPDAGGAMPWVTARDFGNFSMGFRGISPGTSWFCEENQWTTWCHEDMRMKQQVEPRFSGISGSVLGFLLLCHLGVEDR